MINLNKIIVLQEIRAENEKNKEELRMYVLNLLQEIQSKEIRVITSEGKVCLKLKKPSPKKTEKLQWTSLIVIEIGK